MIYLTGFSSCTIAFLVKFLPGILPLFSYLLPTVTTSHCGFCLLSEFPIYNAKCLCYFQFLTTSFSGCMAYLLTWACYTYEKYRPSLLTRVYNVSLSLFVNTMHFKDLSYPQFFRVQECIGPSTSLT